jgi:hypothetical protein
MWIVCVWRCVRAKDVSSLPSRAPMHTHSPTHTNTRMECMADTVVVAVSLVMLFAADANDGIKSIRLVRVARALRLVGRFQSLRAIVEALTQAIFPMMSACILFVMTMSIFAILGVSFFRDVAPTFFGDFGAYVIYARVSVCLFFVCLRLVCLCSVNSTLWVCPDSCCA